jgi:hypothetical protein
MTFKGWILSYAGAAVALAFWQIFRPPLWLMFLTTLAWGFWCVRRYPARGQWPGNT